MDTLKQLPALEPNFIPETKIQELSNTENSDSEVQKSDFRATDPADILDSDCHKADDITRDMVDMADDNSFWDSDTMHGDNSSWGSFAMDDDFTLSLFDENMPPFGVKYQQCCSKDFWDTDPTYLEKMLDSECCEADDRVVVDMADDNSTWRSDQMDDDNSYWKSYMTYNDMTSRGIFAINENFGLSLSEENKLPLRVGAGLYNLGNTCFMNAILQCITHTASLVRVLRSSGHGGCQEFCTLCILKEHIETSFAAPESTIKPVMFAENLRYISSNFEKCKQEDAHEFLQCFLGSLEECCLRSRSNKTCSSQDDNIVEQIFVGSLMSRLRCCSCDHCSVTHERLIDLSLEIDDADTLVSALESFTMVEKIEDLYQMFACEACKERVPVEKQLMLYESPSVLAIHLKRFKAHGCRVEKLSKHVKFPFELDLQPYCLSFPDYYADLKYDLYAVVVHKGFTSAAGHYYCYVRCSPDVWCKFDDWKVTRVHESTVLLEEAYILFYARQGAPWVSDLALPDPNNSVISPHILLYERDSARTSHTSINCVGHQNFESGLERPSHL